MRRPLPLAPRPLFALALALAALFAACGGTEEEPPVDAPPTPPIPSFASWPQPIHVVVFLIDTLRADRLSLYGYGRATSPNLEALAAESVVFEDAIAPSPWTLPSVTSLMLSEFVGRHGVVKDGDRIADDAVPIAARMQALGYRTRSVFRNPYAGPMSGLDRGFETATLANRVVGAADVEACFAEDDPRPLFLYLHNVLPHDPYRPEASFLARFGEVAPEEVDAIAEIQDDYRRLTRHNRPGMRPPGRGDTSDRQGALMAELAERVDAINLLYDAEVAQADAEVGRTVEALKAAGVWDETLFLVLSDHGEEMGEHGGWEHDQSLYEELVHVPLVIHFPYGMYGGRRFERPVSLLDVAPTILDCAGQPPSEGFGSGGSLLIWFAANADPAAGPFVMSWRVNRKKYYRPFDELRGDENIALRDGNWKGIWNVDRGTLELYDLATDPGETLNVSWTEPERSRLFRETAVEWREEFGTSLGPEAPPAAVELDQADRAALRALGYVDEGGH